MKKNIRGVYKYKGWDIIRKSTNFQVFGRYIVSRGESQLGAFSIADAKDSINILIDAEKTVKQIPTYGGMTKNKS